MAKLARRLSALFWQDETGASMVEYALALVLIAVVTIVVISLLGSNLSSLFSSSASSI